MRDYQGIVKPLRRVARLKILLAMDSESKLFIDAS